MATLFIFEYKHKALDNYGRAIEAGEEPITVQKVAFGASTQSDTLRDETRFVELIADSDFHFSVGTDPSADSSDKLVRKGETRPAGISGLGGNIKIAAVSASADISTPVTVLDSSGDSCMDDANDALKVNVVAGAASATQYTEDDTSSGGESLMLAGALRRDAAASSSGTDGDYSTFNVDALGRLWVNGSDVTQPVSGTVTVQDGGGAVSIDDNAGSLTVDSAQLPGALGANGGLKIEGVASGTVVPVADGGGSLTVDGTVTADAGSGPWPVTDNSGSLTVDAPAGTPVNVQIGDGTLQATIRDTGASDSLNVAIVDASGDQIVSFGGGTQYTEDDTSAGGESLTLAGAVRRDTAASSSGTDGDYSTLNTDASGRLWVNGSGVTQPVSIAATVTVDGSGVTQPVSASSLPLPSGAATAANQAGFGTAGLPDSDVLSVQGIASMTPLLVDATGQGDVPVTLDGEAVVLGAGSASIGKLAANSGVDIGDVDVTSQPARAATTDTITAKLATDAIQNGTTALTPKFAAIDAASSGDNTLVAAVTDKKIRVLALLAVAAGTVNVRFESGASGTALTGQMNLVANTGFVLPFNPVGWFETAATTLLNLELSAAISVDGSLVYVEV